MEPAVLDAVGQPLAQGDVVAYCVGSSSRVYIERRRIASVTEKGVYLVPREAGCNQNNPRLAAPYNMVRIPQGQNGKK